MSTLGMIPSGSRQTEMSESIGPASPKISTYREWRERISRENPSWEGIPKEQASRLHDSKGKGIYISPTVESEEEEEEEEEDYHYELDDIDDFEGGGEEQKTTQSTESSKIPISLPQKPSPSIDSTEEEIRLILEAFKRRDVIRDAAQKFPRKKAPPRREDPKSLSQPHPTKTKAKGKPSPLKPPKEETHTKDPDAPDLFGPWNWHWKGPCPISFIPIPPPIDPSQPDPKIEIRYNCRHQIPTRIIPSPSDPPDPTQPTLRSPLPLMPFMQIQTIRAAAKNDHLDHVVADQDSLCPNCFIWTQWFIGLVIIFLVMGVGMYYSYVLLRMGKGKKYRIIMHFDTSGGGRLSY
ncbi:hypothetical protein DSL72_000424 [Monilinia vaccinii-corymbosi]|uniref:Uncharacterized protein n=1 Tax=Monilinia vaccinii-corymbosi TaxID=61207 RepID=A0A8A3P5U3_9HELO|nr:hypothetical protein DSL72_000424 [Monilinia vaccinii-corymbosi]